MPTAEKKATEAVNAAARSASTPDLEKAGHFPSVNHAAVDEVPDPRAWPECRKVCTALLLSLGQLVTLMSASVVAPALPQIERDVHMSDSTAQLVFSIYFIGLATGPFLFSPLSETYGRRWVWMLANLWYALWNALCPVGPSKAMLVAGRLMAGFGASAGVALAGPILADMYGPEKRGRSIALATIFPYLGPAIGPIVGGVVSQHIRWEWLFWILSIFDVALVCVVYLAVRESYMPVLRQRHSKAASNLTVSMGSTWSKMIINLRRPFALLCTRPIILILGFVYGLDFGIYALLLSNYATLWTSVYQQSTQSSSLHYISIALGCTIASQGGGRLMDCIWRRLKAKHGGDVSPEYRVPIMVPSLILMPITLVWYGWCAQNRVSWPVVDAAMLLFNVGSFAWASAALAYMIDEFKDHAASANAATRLMSNMFAFGFPIFAPQLYSKLGYGWGNSLLALLIVVFGWPAPFILWRYGAYLRSVGRPPTEKGAE